MSAHGKVPWSSAGLKLVTSSAPSCLASSWLETATGQTYFISSAASESYGSWLGYVLFHTNKKGSN